MKVKTISMKKNSVGWLFAVIILSILLVLSFALGMSGYYYSITYLNSNTDLVVGENVSIVAKPNQASVVSMTFDGAFLPGENIPQVVQIVSHDLEKDLKVRVKAEIFYDEDVDVDFITNGHFQKATDGYYYFDDNLIGGEKITFCNYLVLPKNSQFVSKQKYILTLVVETLESKFDAKGIWGHDF